VKVLLVRRLFTGTPPDLDFYLTSIPLRLRVRRD
jgi:hypothetical protein